MTQKRKIVFLFPGQGAQYPGMGKDFAAQYSEARQIIEQAEDILKRKLKNIIFDGPEDVLTETGNSQVAIFLISNAILKVIQKLFPGFQPAICSGRKFRGIYCFDCFAKNLF